MNLYFVDSSALVKRYVTEAGSAMLAHANRLSWEFGLRGYDAVQLASALLWREGLGQEIEMATFDRQLWGAARETGLQTIPNDL